MKVYEALNILSRMRAGDELKVQLFDTTQAIIDDIIDDGDCVAIIGQAASLVDENGNKLGKLETIAEEYKKKGKK